MLAFGASERNRRTFVVFTAIVYFIFSCLYVVLCQRNNSLISFFNSNQVVAKHVVITAGSHKLPAVKFLSRPRVIVTKIRLILVAVPFFITIFLLTRARSITVLIFKKSLLVLTRKPVLNYLQVWKI